MPGRRSRGSLVACCCERRYKSARTRGIDIHFVANSRSAEIYKWRYRRGAIHGVHPTHMAGKVEGTHETWVHFRAGRNGRVTEEEVHCSRGYEAFFRGEVVGAHFFVVKGHAEGYLGYLV